MKLTILVVLFNRDTILNDTTKSLLKQGELLGTVDLIIFNNGPGQFLDLNNEFIDSLRSIYSLVEIKQDINNNPLSVIYNEFVKKYPSDYYLILDDDTKISSDYINKTLKLAIEESPDVLLPAIISNHNGEVYYPFIDGSPIKDSMIKAGCRIVNNDVCSIGSGLTISHRVLQEFSREGLDAFDERFALYGVDFSFFRRLNFLKYSGCEVSCYIVDYIIHDMSGVQKKISRNRYIEREFDKVLSIKHHSSNLLYSYIKIFKLMVGYLFQRDLDMGLRAFKVYLSGRHPRCVNVRRGLFS